MFCNSRNVLLRLSSSTAKPKKPVVYKPRIKKPIVGKHADEVLNFFASSEVFQQNKPNIHLKYIDKKPKTPDALYLMDENVAAQIFSTIQSHLLKEGCPIFEANPGIGLLTQQFLNNNISRVSLFESDPLFKVVLFKLVNMWPNHLTIYNTNILELWKLTFQDKLDNGNRMNGLMDGVEPRSWSDPPFVQIIGALPSNKFLKHILFSIIFQSGLICYGRPQLFTLLSPHLVLQLCLENRFKYIRLKSSSILIQLFCDWEDLGTFDRKAFLPWQSEVTSYPKDPKIDWNVDFDKLHLIKITPKKELYDIIPKPLLKPFWYFIKHHLSHKKYRVIDHMERWVPGCGPRLICKGFNVFTLFDELTVQEFLMLFKEFSSWPEFQTSPFLAAMESTLLNLEQTDGILDEFQPENKEAEDDIPEKTQE